MSYANASTNYAGNTAGPKPTSPNSSLTTKAPYSRSSTPSSPKPNSEPSPAARADQERPVS
jgi:hypothetical protein